MRHASVVMIRCPKTGGGSTGVEMDKATFEQLSVRVTSLAAAVTAASGPTL
jgi:hypothetical protein